MSSKKRRSFCPFASTKKAPRRKPSGEKLRFQKHYITLAGLRLGLGLRVRVRATNFPASSRRSCLHRTGECLTFSNHCSSLALSPIEAVIVIDIST